MIVAICSMFLGKLENSRQEAMNGKKKPQTKT